MSDCGLCGCAVSVSTGTGAESGTPYNKNSKVDQSIETFHSSRKRLKSFVFMNVFLVLDFLI
jgi:hypothetical protein